MVLYRIESFTEWVDEDTHRVKLRVDKYQVINVTPKGYTIALKGWPQVKRFVNSSSKKKFACVTIEEAEKCFLARKRRETAILSARLDHIEKAVKLVKGIHDEWGSEVKLSGLSA